MLERAGVEPTKNARFGPFSIVLRDMLRALSLII